MQYPVDAVITWVDSREPQVMESLLETSRLQGVAVDPARYTSNNEIFWSVKYIRKFMPWINKIFVVTNGQRCDLSGVEFVDHESILPKGMTVKCFNSEYIEWHCHNIKGLSQSYVMFNDDMFVGKPIKPEDICGRFGLGLLWFDQSPIDFVNDVSNSKTAQARSALNTFLTLEYGHGALLAPAHVPRFQFKPLVERLYEKNREYIRLLSRYPLRDVFSFPLYIIYTYEVIKFIYGSADIKSLMQKNKEVKIPGWHDYVFVPLGSPTSDQWLKRVTADRPRFFCLNDHFRDDRSSAADLVDAFCGDYLQSFE